MSMVLRCGNVECMELVTRCRCERSPLFQASDQFGLIDDKDPPELQPENKKGWNLGE